MYNILDLFCGAGGFSYGLHQVNGFETKVALDFNKEATITFSKNMPNAKVICGDITNKDIKEEIIKLSKDNNVNMVIGGPPCQGFSLKGKKLGLNDPRNFLFLEYFNIVKELKPKIFIIENVKAIIHSENGYFKNQIIETFSSLGYKVTCDILKAKNFGIPQSRERAFFIGSLNEEIELPMGNDNIVTVRDAIEDLAYLNAGEGSFEMNYINEPTSQYQKDRRNGQIKLYNHQATKHSKVAIEKLELIKPECGKECLPKEMWGNQKFSCTWGRLKWNDISPTIDTRFDTPSNGTNSHPFLHRAITPREAARIQSFDDSFIFYGNKTSICKQIGNAVPPLLAKALGEQIQKSIS